MSSIVNESILPTNEIKVKANSGLSRYVKYALKMFQANQRTLVLKGAGTATSKVLHLTEILKRRIGDLHQINRLYSVEVDDRREGCDDDAKRRMSVFETILSVDPLNEGDIGYQKPVQKEEGTWHPPRRNYQNGYRQGNNYREGEGYDNYRGDDGYIRDDCYPDDDYREGNYYRQDNWRHEDDLYYRHSPRFNAPRYGNYNRQKYGCQRRFKNNHQGTFCNFLTNFSAYKPRRYQNQWSANRRSRFDAISQGPSQRLVLHLFTLFFLFHLILINF